MTKNDFIYALKASGCLYRNGQTYYEENELIRTFEDMEMFEEEKSLKDMTKLEHAIRHIKTRADAWAVKEVTEALQSISERLDKALSQEPCDDAVSRILKRMWNCRGKHTTSIDKVAMEQIIRDELSSVNPQPCDDAISREWLKTAIHNFYYGLKHTPTEEDIQAYIDVAPPVTQKSGEWIKHNTGHSTYYSCSKCSCLAPNTEVADGVIWKLSKYCPNCGAKMKSEDKE